jgi:hypothetical protein
MAAICRIAAQKTRTLKETQVRHKEPAVNATRITILSAFMLLLTADDARAQLDITNFGKGKKASKVVLSPAGPQPSFWEAFNPFGNKANVMTFEKPVSAVDRLHASTQRVLGQTRAAFTKPIHSARNIKLWPTSGATDDQTFSLVPGWLKPSAGAKPPQTVTDFLAQPRPQE